METVERFRFLKGRWSTKVFWGKQNRTLKTSLVITKGPPNGLIIEASIPWVVGLRLEKVRNGFDYIGEESRQSEYSLEVTRSHLQVVAGEHRNENTWFNGSIFLFRWQRLKWNNNIYQKHLRQVIFDDVVFFPQEDLELVSTQVRLVYQRRYRFEQSSKLFPVRREKWVSAILDPPVPTRTGSISKVIVPSKRRFDKTECDLQTLAHVVKHISKLREA